MRSQNEFAQTAYAIKDAATDLSWLFLGLLADAHNHDLVDSHYQDLFDPEFDDHHPSYDHDVYDPDECYDEHHHQFDDDSYYDDDHHHHF
jgi:hypothetical protein